MATTYTVQQNQSMSDVVICATGSLDAAMQMCWDNQVSRTMVPVPGTVYVVSDAALASGNAANLRYLKQKGITIGTLGELLAAGFTIVAEDGTTPIVTESGNTITTEI